MLHKNDQIGDYRLDKFLGKGQFGEVWLAEKQIQFSKKKIRHALKFLLSRGAEIDLKQAQDEIDTWIEAGGHPNVISVLDMLVYEGHVVIVSEYADGGSLKDWLRQHDGKAPTPEKAAEMMNGILRGIEHLHSRSVIHRDLKPENILLQGDFPRITDFGISRIVLESTTTTQAIGSPAYMSPEAFLGSKTPSTDIWSAGVILYELLTGTLPFEGRNLFHLKEIIEQNEPQPLPPEISPELREVVMRALEKDRAKRFQTAREMRLALETASYNLRKNAQEILDATVAYDETIPFNDPLPPRAGDAGDSLNPTQSLENQPDKTQPAQTQATPTVSAPAAVANSGNIQPPPPPPASTQPAGAKSTGGDRTEEEIRDKAGRTTDDEILEEPEAEMRKIALAVEQQTRSQKTGIGGGSGAKLLTGGLIAAALAGLVIFLLLRPTETPLSNVNSTETNSNVSNSQPPVPPEGMAYIPGGEFTMGRDDGKSEAERPAHPATVKPFFMDLTEVTNEKYAEFMRAEKYRAPFVWKDSVMPKGQEKFPVVGVDWEDAGAYCKYAGKRLPTEEEWEFAARGANKFIYPWGNEWKSGNANAVGANKNFTEVGKYGGKSPFGLVDMVGNAWEWTASDFKQYPGGKLPDVFAGKNNLKTLRGSSFEATREYATTTYRIGLEATGAENFYQQSGFRCARDIE